MVSECVRRLAAGHVVEFTEWTSKRASRRKINLHHSEVPTSGRCCREMLRSYSRRHCLDGLYERDCAVSPDGKEIYYSVFIGGWATIMLTRNLDGKWTEPTILPFASDPEFNSVEPCLSADGKRLFFLSTLPPAVNNRDVAGVIRTSGSLTARQTAHGGKPYDLGQPINTPDQEYFPSLTRDGNALLFFGPLPVHLRRSIAVSW